MRCTPQYAVELVEILAASYTKTLSDVEAQVFIDALCELDGDIARRTIDRVRSIDQWFPSLARLRHIAAELIVDLAADGPAPPRSDTTDIHPDVLRSQVRVLREAMKPGFAATIDDACDATFGAGQWTPADRADVVRGMVYDRVLDETGREPFPNPSGTIESRVSYRCLRCSDTAWIDDADGAVHPCETCAPVPHRRWREGHWHPNHHCSECSIVRRTGAMP